MKRKRNSREFGLSRVFSPAFKSVDGNKVILIEALPIGKEQLLEVRLLSAKSNRRHGVWVYADAGVIIGDMTYPSVHLWKDTAPPVVRIKAHSTIGILNFYNIWEEDGVEQSQMITSGMVHTEKDGVHEYRCNDYGYDPAFDDLVFTVKLLDS